MSGVEIIPKKNVFGSAEHSRIVFCIDGSDRYKDVKEMIYKQVIAYLLQLKKNVKTAAFDVVLFGEKTIKFSFELKPATERNIKNLERWMRNANLGSLSYALPALMTSVSLADYCTIYFVTDGYTDDNEELIQSEIKNLCRRHDILIFLISEQLPPDERSLRMFRELAIDNPEAWGSITLITSRRQAENLMLTTVSLSSTESISLGGFENYRKRSEDMEKWLSQQATLVSGERMQPSPKARPPSRTRANRSTEKNSWRSRASQSRNRKTSRKSPERSKSLSRRDSGRKTPQSTKSYSNSDEDSDEEKRHSSRSPHSRSMSRQSRRNTLTDRKSHSGDRNKHKDSSRKSSRSSSRRNTPYNSHSRSSSRERERYYNGVHRRSSVRSSSSSISSAGSLLLGRHVLAPRRDQRNQLYLGVIKSQKKDKVFGVVFCIPYGGHGEDDGLEYCMQEVEIDDILSYTDLYQHSICEKDDVLVPAVFLQLREGRNRINVTNLDPPYAGQPYVLAVVHKGFEQRSSQGIGSPSRKSSSLIVKVAGGRKPRLCEIPIGCALWISEKQARRLYHQDCHFFEGNGDGERDSSPFHEERESLCMHGRPNSPIRDRDNDDDRASRASSRSSRRSLESGRSRGRSSTTRGHRDVGSAASVTSSVVEKRSQSSGAAKRPMWQYFGKAHIPDIIDPPSHEPYIAPRVIGPSAIANSNPSSEWPAAHFAIVNHTLENTVAQNDSRRVYEALRQIGDPPPLSKSSDVPLNRSHTNPRDLDSLLYSSWDGNEEELAGLSLRDLYRQKMMKNLRKSKAASSGTGKRPQSVAKSIKSQ